jgi:hypothetical protein
MEELYDPQNVFLKTRIPINPKEFVAVVTVLPEGEQPLHACGKVICLGGYR